MKRLPQMLAQIWHRPIQKLAQIYKSVPTYLLVALLLTGCKSHRTSQAHYQQQSTWQHEGNIGRLTHAQWIDTLLSSWKKQLQGNIILWSAPDAAGQQYKQAEIAFRTDEHREDLRSSHLQATDSLQVQSTAQETTHQEASHHRQATLQSKGIPWTRLIIFLALSLLAWFFYRRKKNRQ